jgi:glutamate-1-semialdehyde aminotransferase
MAEAKNEESISQSGNTVRPLNQQEMEALTKDLQDVLVKHNAEMGVTSTINLMKVVKTTNEPANTSEEAQETAPEATPQETT